MSMNIMSLTYISASHFGCICLWTGTYWRNFNVAFATRYKLMEFVGIAFAWTSSDEQVRVFSVVSPYAWLRHTNTDSLSFSFFPSLSFPVHIFHEWASGSLNSLYSLSLWLLWGVRCWSLLAWTFSWLLLVLFVCLFVFVLLSQDTWVQAKSALKL